MDGTGEGESDFRGNLEVGGLEDGTEADTHNGKARTPDGDEAFSGRTSGGQDTEGE